MGEYFANQIGDLYRPDADKIPEISYFTHKACHAVLSALTQAIISLKHGVEITGKIELKILNKVGE